MTDFLMVTDTMFVAPQIDESDIDRAALDGFGLIINNRPDGEANGQPLNSDLAAYAAAKGLKWAFIPVVPGQLTMEAIDITGHALNEGVKTLAFCRTGTRSCTLWGLALAKQGNNDTNDILAKARNAGYDLSGIAPTMEHLHASA